MQVFRTKTQFTVRYKNLFNFPCGLFNAFIIQWELLYNLHSIKICVISYSLPQGQQEIQQRKILYMGLYLLIWGEAANVRFMPECLCYIFHNVSAHTATNGFIV